MAVGLRCPDYRFLHEQHHRSIGDLDYIGRFLEKRRVEKLFVEELGYGEDRGVKTIPGIKRSVFLDFRNRRHVDVFYDELNMCHRLDMRERLDVNVRTIAPADLLLQKLQIVQINEKDLLDCSILMLQFPLEDGDDDAINLAYLASLCAHDWGLWRTVTWNVSRLEGYAASLEEVGPEEGAILQWRIKRLCEELDEEPKSLAWRIRAVAGERIRWYREVEERV
jgi:hypothetical protein